jgi:serine/threonine protein kinase
VVDTTASALEQVCVGRPDIALIRSELPELDCDVLLRCIRKFPGLSLLPVVMVQESWDEESLQLAERSGVEHRLTKPFRLREVSGNILRMASRFRKSARPSMALRPGLVLKDRFLLREPVHQSRHHVIYEAFDQREKQVVACKALRPDAMAEPKAVERFSCEVRALKKLSHPSILPLLDDGVEPVTRIPFFLMPYWPHGTLADRLEQEGALPLAEAIVLTGKLADALEAMHERELLHCDVKASNVLLTEDGEPILADFGFALHMREKHLWPDVPAGTPSAMAPEQFSVPPDLDGRSDLFSLGLLFVELATGEHLLASLPIHDIHHQVTTSDLRRSSLVQERIPAFARELCMRSLARHREERFPSAYAMAQACRAVLGTMKNRADFVS